VNSIQITPPGFQCVFLPFEDDVRDLDAATGGAEGVKKAGRELVDAAKSIVAKVRTIGSGEHNSSN
tara:strand:- start:342 stop:539 length:198 start_codon:yes stop_codon:yes gene_type:complete